MAIFLPFYDLQGPVPPPARPPAGPSVERPLPVRHPAVVRHDSDGSTIAMSSERDDWLANWLAS